MWSSVFDWPPDTSATRLAGATLLIACAALILTLVPVFAHWTHRRKVWLTQPERLLEPPPSRPFVHTAVLALGVLVGAGALLVPTALVTPISAALAAIAVLVIAHRCFAGPLSSVIGLVLAGMAVALCAVAWLPNFGANAALGCALAAAYLLWLARFWEQQLLDGVAWTTTGRLIPSARRIGWVAAAIGVALAAPAAFAGTWVALLTIALCALAVIRLGHGRTAPPPKQPAAPRAQ